MKREKILALGLSSAIALGAAFTSPAIAAGDHSQNNGQENAATNGAMMGGQNNGGSMMGGSGANPGHGGQGGGMMGGQGGGGMMGGQGGGDMMQMMQMMMKMHGQMGGQMGGMGGADGMGDMIAFDANGDGTVSMEEALAGLAAKLAEFDADGDGSLSIAEFEVLNSAAIREQMVDRFQALDNDGDGFVTGEEMAAPAANMGQMGQGGMGAGMGSGMGSGMVSGMGSNNADAMQGQDN